MIEWLPRVLGLSNATGAFYLFWSGVGTSLGVLGAAGLFYQHRKCVSCFRYAMHHVEGTAWSTCHKHLTRARHDSLLAEYTAKYPEQAEFLASDRADSENLIQP